MGKRARAARRRGEVGYNADRSGGADRARYRRDVRSVVLDAATTCRAGDTVRLRGAVQRLVADPGGFRVVEGVVDEELRAALASCWARGWQPADVERVVRRRLDAGATDLLVGALADERRTYATTTVEPAWDDQLAALDAEVRWPAEATHLGAWTAARPGRTPLDAALAATVLLALLAALPPLPRLAPPPGTAPTSRVPTPAGAAAARDLARVRALLAKAESTQFFEEAEALAAKAQELLARHSMDRSMLDADAGVTVTAAGRRFGIEDPYAGAKSLLLAQVAGANRCRSVHAREFGFAAVYGLAGDLAAIDLLFTSLLVQADRAIAAAGSQVDRSGRSRTRSFRQAFLVGFATRVGARLRQAGAAGLADAETAHGAALVPVLAARDAAVDAAFSTAYPRTVRSRVGTTNAAGWAAGAAAGDAATLDRGRALRGSADSTSACRSSQPVS